MSSSNLCDIIAKIYSSMLKAEIILVNHNIFNKSVRTLVKHMTLSQFNMHLTIGPIFDDYWTNICQIIVKYWTDVRPPLTVTMSDG